MSDDEFIDVRIRLRDARRFQAEAAASAKAAEGIGRAAERTGGRAKRGAVGLAAFQRAAHGVGTGLMKSGKGMRSFGRDMTRNVTTPVAAVTAGAVYAGIKWESAWTGVEKTVDAPASALGKLEGQLRSMARNTLPASHEEIAAVAEAAGQLGVKTPKIAAFTKTMIGMGEATNLSSDMAATQLAQIANITGMSQSKFSNLASTIVGLGNAGASTESDISGMALRIAGAGNQIDMSEDQIVAWAAALANVGINAEAGGSSISTAFLKINSAVKGGGEKLAGFAKVAGMSSSDFKQMFEKDSSGAVAKFVTGLSGIKKEGGDVQGTLNDLGLSGIRMSQALLGLSGRSEDLNKTLDDGAGFWMTNNALTKETAKRYKTTESQLKLLRNKVFDLGVTYGSILLPVVVEVSETFVRWLTKIAKWFDKLPKGMQKMIVGVIILAAVMGPMIFMMGLMVTGLGGIVTGIGWVAGALIWMKNLMIITRIQLGLLTAQQVIAALRARQFATALGLVNLAFLANPVFLTIAGIIAIGVAFYFAYTRSEKFRKSVHATLGWLETNWPSVAPIVAGPLGIIAGKFYSLGRGAIQLWNDIKSAFSKIVSFVNSIKSKIQAEGMWAGIKEAFRQMLNFIISGWNSLEFRIPGFDPPGPGPKFGGLTVGVPDLPLLAQGGVLAAAGGVVVGDDGPEILELPRAAVVRPLPTPGIKRPRLEPLPDDVVERGKDGRVRRIVVPLFLKGRQIAEAVYDDVAEREELR